MMNEKDRRIASIVGRIYQCVGGLNVLCGVGFVLSWLSGAFDFEAVAPQASSLYPTLNAMNAMTRYLGAMGLSGILLGIAVFTASTAFLRFRPWGRRVLIGVSIFFMLLVVSRAFFMASIIPHLPGLPAIIPKAFGFAIVIVFLVPLGLVTYWLLSRPVREMFL